MITWSSVFWRTESVPNGINQLIRELQKLRVFRERHHGMFSLLETCDQTGEYVPEFEMGCLDTGVVI